MKERNKRKPLINEFKPFLPQALTLTVILKTACERETDPQFKKTYVIKDIKSECNEEGNAFCTDSYHLMADFFFFY